MYEFLVQNPIAALIIALVVLVAAVYLVVKFIQTIGLEKIRGYVYEWMTEAETKFQHGDNEQKLEYVVQLARSHLPYPANKLITTGLLKKTIVVWFKAIKVLLNYGREEEK